MYFVIKKSKRGVFYSTDPADDVARMLTWRARPARMRHGTEATWQGRAWPTQGEGTADTWQEATRVHANAREGCHMAGGSAGEGPTG